MNNYYMGIDNGGSLCKAVIFDSKGKEISSASRNLVMINPAPGFTERDMEELWLKNCEIIRETIETSGLDAAQIKGVACSGHGKGLYLWGKDDQPCYNGIVSTDARAWEYPEKWYEDGTAERVFEKTFQSILACQPVSLLNWLKDNEPEVIGNIKWIFEVKDYIRFRLTGEAFAEMTDYSGSNMMNLKERRFDKELLKEFNLEDMFDKLPPLKKSTEICGTITEETEALTGLKAGTVVAGGMFDIDACAIAMDITNDENIAVIAGTWSINEYISKEPVLNKSIMMNSIYCIDEYYLIEECSPTSAGNNAWFVNLFLEDEKHKAKEAGMNVYDYCNRMADKVLPAESNICFLPYIFGSNYNPRAKACMVGLEKSNTREQVVRAVYEGIAYCHKVHLEKLLMNRTETRAIRLSGGAAKSDVWAQIFSDVFELPVETIDNDELGALGCAMTATVAAGEYKNLKEAAQNMVRIKNKIYPNKGNEEIYRKKYGIYKKTSDALDDTWKLY
jgi:L-xylulokinase